MGLELISELDLTGSHQGTYRQPYILDWHRKASAYIRNMDIHKHLLTTHFSGDYHVIDARVAQDDCLDYIVVDAYRNGVSDFPSNVRDAAANLVMYKKPFMITEYGGAWNGTDELGLEADLHSGIWAYWMTPAGGTPLLWWFDFIDRKNLYFHYTAFKAFTDGEDHRKSSGYAQSFQQLPNGLAAMTYGDKKSGWGWVYNVQEMTYLPAPGQRRVEEGVMMSMFNIEPGQYDVEFWDTYTGEVVETKQIMVESGGELKLLFPRFRADTAFKYRPAAK
jgi:hypothetical protein